MKPYLICYRMPGQYEQYYTVMATSPKHAREVFLATITLNSNVNSGIEVWGVYQQVD